MKRPKKLGILSLELVPSELLRDVRQQGLGMALANNGMPDLPFQKGLNNLRYQDEVIERTKEAIDECVEFGIPNVIAFTGYKLTNADDPQSAEISREEAAVNCVAGLKHLAGYQGDDLDYCAAIIERVGLSNGKLLFDCVGCR